MLKDPWAIYLEIASCGMDKVRHGEDDMLTCGDCHPMQVWRLLRLWTPQSATTSCNLIFLQGHHRHTVTHVGSGKVSSVEALKIRKQAFTGQPNTRFTNKDPNNATTLQGGQFASILSSNGQGMRKLWLFEGFQGISTWRSFAFRLGPSLWNLASLKI